jgi:altronate dehydratase
LNEAAQRLFNEIVDVAAFKRTKAEILGYEKFFNIYVKGPVI